MNENKRRNLDFNKTNWDIKKGFVSHPKRIFRTISKTPLSIDQLQDGGFMEKVMWKHTRFMLDAFVLVKQKEYQLSHVAHSKAAKVLSLIAEHVNRFGFQGNYVEKRLLEHVKREFDMGNTLLKGNQKYADTALSQLMATRFFSEAFEAADWSKIHKEGTRTLRMFMRHHSYAMYTYAEMLNNIDSYSKSKAIFEQPELVCLEYGMEVGALLDKIMKVGLKHTNDDEEEPVSARISTTTRIESQFWN